MRTFASPKSLEPHRLCRFLPALFIILVVHPAPAQMNETVDVQVVDLQVSVTDKSRSFIKELKPEDFLVWEDGVQQEVLDLELKREPFSIGVLLDTSSSMQPYFKITTQGTQEFLWSLAPEDEFFLMTFDDRVLMKKDIGFAAQRTALKLNKLHYGERTRMYDGILSAVDHLRSARYPRRALFIISDGINTYGDADLKQAIETAQRNKVLIYTLLLDSPEADNSNALVQLSEATGGSFFVLYGNYPRLQAAYEKIARDLANRFTLYYRSRSDYSQNRKPEIKVQVKNPEWQVRFQKAYYPH